MDGHQQNSELKIKFGGAPDEIDVNTLLRSLTNITTTIEEINNEVGEGQKLDIKIKALDKGSFLIHLRLLAVELVDLVKSIDLDVSVKVITILVGILSLRKLLSGKKPKKITEKGDNIIITTESGNKVTVDKRTFNIYNSNAKISEAISENFEVLKSDSSIDSFEIQDVYQKQLFHAPREEFEKMSVGGLEEIPDENKKIITQSAVLNIIKIVWDINRKWEFIYRANKISAHISDESFFGRIDKGEQFSKGDTLEVELEITQVFDQSVNTYLNESYLVTRVRKHNPRSEQETLFNN